MSMAVILNVTYDYDDLNRLRGDYAYNTQVDPATSVYDRLYNYDKAGNRFRMLRLVREQLARC